MSILIFLDRMHFHSDWKGIIDSKLLHNILANAKEASVHQSFESWNQGLFLILHEVIDIM